MHNKGFSLIELIVVIIMISILAVSVAPKFDGTDSYEAHTHRAHLISALRLTQQRAMQQTDNTTGYCHDLTFDDAQARYGIPNRIDCTPTSPTFPSGWSPDATGYIATDRDISFNVDGASNPQVIGFDWMGRPTGLCASGCVINIVHATNQSLKINIESEGYIHVLDLP